MASLFSHAKDGAPKDGNVSQSAHHSNGRIATERMVTDFSCSDTIKVTFVILSLNV